ncbi:hypothetical protein HK097_010008, partial [Rhizophlyctis rosea]
MADKEGTASDKGKAVTADQDQEVPAEPANAEKNKPAPPASSDEPYSSRQSRAPSTLPPLSDSPSSPVTPTDTPNRGSPITPLFLLLALPTTLFLAVDLSLAYFRSPTTPPPTSPPSPPPPPSWAWRAFKRVVGFGGSGKSVPSTSGSTNTGVASKWTVGGLVWGASAAVVLAVVVARAVTIWADEDTAEDSSKSKEQQSVKKGDEKQEGRVVNSSDEKEGAEKSEESVKASGHDPKVAVTAPPTSNKVAISDVVKEKESIPVLSKEEAPKSAEADPKKVVGMPAVGGGGLVATPDANPATKSPKKVAPMSSGVVTNKEDVGLAAAPKVSATSALIAKSVLEVVKEVVALTKPPSAEASKPPQSAAEWPARAESLAKRDTPSPVPDTTRPTTSSSSDLPPRADSLSSRKSQQDLSTARSPQRHRSPSPPPDNVDLPSALTPSGSASPRVSRPLPAVPNYPLFTDPSITPPDSPSSSRRARSRSKPRPLPNVPGGDGDLSDFGHDVLQSIRKLGSSASLDAEKRKSLDEVHPGVLEVVGEGGLAEMIVRLGSEGKIHAANSLEHDEPARIPMRRGRTSDQIEYSAAAKFPLARKAEGVRPQSMIEPGTAPRMPASSAARIPHRGRPITMLASPLLSESMPITIPPRTLRHLALPLHPTPQNITSLDLSSNFVTHLPPELFIQSPYLQCLNLSGCHLEGLPETIGNCKELREINVSDNFLKGLCREVGDLRGLEKLNLARNAIGFLENTLFTTTPSVAELDLTGNKLRHLPASLGLLSESLTTLVLKDNPFDPTLEKLVKPLILPVVGSSGKQSKGSLGSINSGEFPKSRTPSLNSGGDTGRLHPASAPPTPGRMRDRTSSGGDVLYQHSRASFGSTTSISTDGSGDSGDRDMENDPVMSPTSLYSPPSRQSSFLESAGDTASIDTKATLMDDGYSGGSSDMDGMSLGASTIHIANSNVFFQRLLGHLRDAYELNPLIFPDNDIGSPDRPSGAKIVRLTSDSDTASISSQMTAEEETKAKKKLVPGMREKVAMELVHTERTYVRELQSLVDIYLTPLETAAREKGEEILTPQEIALVFSNVRSVLMFHRDHVLPDLEECLQDPTQPLGSALLKMSPFLKMYQMYYNTFDAANTYTTTLETAFKITKSPTPTSRSSGQQLPLPPGHPPPTKPKAKKFRHYIRKCKTHSRHTQISLQAFLILPVQRLPRYKLLAEELLSRTPPDHPDWVNLTKAVESIKKRVDECNEGKR